MVDLRYFKRGILLDLVVSKYQRFTPSGCNKDLEIRKFEFVANFGKFVSINFDLKILIKKECNISTLGFQENYFYFKYFLGEYGQNKYSN